MALNDQQNALLTGVIPSPATQTNPGSTIGTPVSGAVKAPPGVIAPPALPPATPSGVLPPPNTAAGGNDYSGTDQSQFATAQTPPTPATPAAPAATTPAPSGGGPTTIAGLGTWEGTGWSGSGNVNGQGYGGNLPGGSDGGGGGASPSYGGETPGAPAGAAFDDGGSVGDSGSLGDALNTIKDTLDYGRQQSGFSGGGQQGVLPDDQRVGGDHASTNVEDDRDSSTVGQAEGPTPKMGAAASPLGPTPQPVAQPYPYGPKVGVGQSSAGAGAVTPSFDDGGDMGNPMSAGMPAAPQTNQPTPQQGQVAPQQGNKPPPSIVGYVMGAGGLPPDQAQALEGRVDPQGQMDPSARKMLAIANAPDQKTQWALMQYYRQHFNMQSAFARAAATGTPQKPADIAASATAATKAFSNIPDGTSTTFQPTKTGVIAHVKHLAGGKVQAHAGGGDVNNPENTPIPPAPKQDQLSYDDGGDVENPMSDPAAQAYQSDTNADTSTPGAGKQDDDSGGTAKDTSSQQQDQSIPLTGQQFTALLSKLPYDAIMDNGAVETLKQYASTQNQVQDQKDFPQHAAQNAARTDTTVPNDTSDAATAPQDVSVLGQPNAGLSPQKSASIQNFNKSNGGVNRPGSSGQFAADENGDVSGVRVVAGGRPVPQGTEAQRTQKSAIELQQEKNKGMAQLGGIRAGAQEQVANTRAATSTQNNERTVGARLQGVIIAATGRELSAGAQQLVSRANNLTTADPSFATDPQRLAAALAPFAGQAGLNYAQLQQIVHAATQPQQVARPAENGALPPQAVQQLKEGQHTTFKNGQTWTLQNGAPVQVQ